MIVERIMKPGSEAKVFLRRAFEEANRYRKIGYYALSCGSVKGITKTKGRDYSAFKRLFDYLRDFGGEKQYLPSNALPILVPQILKRYQQGLSYSGQENTFPFRPTAKTFKRENRIWLPIYQKYVKLFPLREDDPIAALFIEGRDLFKTVSIVSDGDNNFRAVVRIKEREVNDNGEEN